MSPTVQGALSVVVIALGLAGLKFGIEYSGWALFLGCVGFYCAL